VGMSWPCCWLSLCEAWEMLSKVSNLGLELGLDGGKRERVLHIVVIEITFAGRRLAALPVLAIGALGRALERGRTRGHRHDRLAVGADHRRRHGLGVGPGIGCFEVDDVAQEHLSLVELVAPDDDSLE